MTKELKDAARAALNALDKFVEGAELTDAETETHKAVIHAGAFAAAAYEAAPAGGSEVYFLSRYFLLAIIDPYDQALDYLRVSPAAGALGREINARLDQITKDK